VHFLSGTSAADIAHKVVAVNLSDLAAMGAEPAWLNLSLTMPCADEAWLESFSEQIAQLSEYYSVQLIGGDTVKLDVQDAIDREFLVNRHLRPTPRVLAGTCLRRIASACIDVSDGLLQDVQHIANASNTGVLLQLDKLPISPALGKNVASLEKALEYATSAGDDYELLFTVSEEQKTSMSTTLDSYSIPILVSAK
jgi:thiamine-monophosphate kinase